MTIEEIAQLLNVPTPTVARVLANGRMLLTREIGLE